MPCKLPDNANGYDRESLRIEVAVLRSDAYDDDFVWEQYAPLIGMLCIDRGAHFFIAKSGSGGEDKSARTEEESLKERSPEEIDYVLVATGNVADAFLFIADRLKTPVGIITDGRYGSLLETLSLTVLLRQKGVEYKVIQGDNTEISRQIGDKNRF